MKISSEEEWEQALDQYLELTLVTIKLGFLAPDTAPMLDEIDKALHEFQNSSTKYTIVCTKDCYVGQGVDWIAGQIYHETWSRRDAQSSLEELSQDPWCKDCWELVIHEPRI